VALRHKADSLLFLIFCFLLCPEIMSGQDLAYTDEKVRDSVIKMGMEDVAVVDEPDGLYINYSDNIYRGPFRGAFEVFTLLLNDLQIDKSIILILKVDRIPYVSLKLDEEQVRAYQSGRLSLVQLMSASHISYDIDKYNKLFKGVKAENNSAGKIDIVLYPQVSLNNSWLDKLYGAIINIAPAVEVGLWKGASFTGQAIFPLWNNMTGEMDYIRAGMLVLRQEYRFPENIFMAFNIGNFNANRMGANLSFKYIPAGDQWEAGVNAGITGSSTFNSGKWEVSQWKRVNGAVFLRYNEPLYNLQFDLTGQRYIYGDYGIRLDCVRHFGEVAIGFYGMYTGGEPNGGFNLAIPLSGKKHMKRNAVRISAPEYFDWEYEAQSGNEYFKKRLGRYYEMRPDENRSQRYYNPAYMKNMLIKLASEYNNQN